MLLAVSVTAVLKLLIKASVSVSSFPRARVEQTFLPSLLEKFQTPGFIGSVLRRVGPVSV